MPNRIIREGINDSERVDRLSPEAEVFYRRLMSAVDDFGRFDARPVVISAKCFPLRRENPNRISKWLAECCIGPNPLIVVYEVRGRRYLELQDFRQQVRSKNSKYPAPADGSPVGVDEIKRVADAQQMITDAQQMHSARVADAQHMHTKTETYSESESETKTVVNVATPAWRMDSQYCEFVEVYREAKPDTIDDDFAGSKWHWNKLDASQRQLAIDNVKARVLSGDWKFPPHPSNWLKTEYKRPVMIRAPDRSASRVESLFEQARSK
jgi:hypothetical protein